MIATPLDAASPGPSPGRHPAAAEDPAPVLRFRALFISDIHLGTAGCQAAKLLEFLRLTDSQHLYLVGDIIDGWQLKRRFYWHQSHNDVIQKILRKARKGTRVTWIAGNHDEAMRHFLGVAFGGIEIADEAVHATADGRQLLVIHGDLFDAVVQRARWLAFVGDHLYTLALYLNRWFNHFRAKLGFPYWSLSQYLKHKVKNAVSYITDFEEALAREARRRRFDGVVCGHIHKAEIRDIDGILYCNDGDWVESMTALAEMDDGELRIIDWRTVEAAVAGATAPAAPVSTQVPAGGRTRLPAPVPAPLLRTPSPPAIRSG